MKFTLYIYIAISLSLSASPISAQTEQLYTNNFTPFDYGGSEQNWCVIQDEYGRIYVANNNGVLIYDCGRWKSVLMRDSSRCLSLDKDNHNRIYAGGEHEFGYLTKSLTGKMEYESLSKGLSKNDQDFSYVWSVQCIDEDVFFCSNEKIFWYRKGNIKSFSSESDGFNTFFKVGCNLFIREKNIGLKVFVNGQLKKVENSGIFSNDRVGFILPYANTTYWLGSRNSGLYLMDYNPTCPEKSVFTKKNPPADEWMKKNQLHCGAKVNENTYAFGSLEDGVILVDSNCRILKKLNQRNGILDNGVKNIFVDPNENLWLSLNYGISYVEYNIPVTRWTRENEVKGVVETAVKYEGRLYIASAKGMFVLDTSDNKFTDTPIKNQCWSFLVVGNHLLVGTSDGLYSFSQEKSKLLNNTTIYSLFADPIDTARLYMGTDKGLIIANYTGNSLAIIRSFDDWGDVRSAGISKEGELAFGTSGNGIYMFPRDKEDRPLHLTVKEGLPSLNENRVFTYKGKLLIGTEKGFYGIRSTSRTPECFKMSLLSSISKENPVIKAKQINDEIWFDSRLFNEENHTTSEIIRSVNLIDKKLSENNRMLGRIVDTEAKDFFSDGKKVYISTSEGLYCYDTDKSTKLNDFYSFISRILFANDTSFSYENWTGNNDHTAIEVPYTSNEITIIPGGSDYYDKGDLKFSYYLQGKETNYGRWSKSKEIVYNNLHEGNYVFHLKTRNILGQGGKEASLSFTILPPWYRTWWAYLSYLLIVFGINAMLFRWRVKIIENREKANLRTIIENQEKDRARIARDLHDGVAQTLASTIMKIENTISKPEIASSENGKMLRSSVEIMRDTHKEVRIISHEMTPRALKEGKFSTVISELLDNVFSGTQIKYSFETHGDVDISNMELKIGIYRILQELTGNIIKHANAENVSIQFMRNQDEIVILVEDDGVGLKNASKLKLNQGMGMTNVKTRVSLLNGVFSLEAGPLKGVVAQVRLPVTVEKTG